MEEIETIYSRVKFHKSTRKQNAVAKKHWQMHRCLSFCMRLMRLAGYFPVEGLGKSNISDLRYNVKGFYGVYHLIVILMTSFPVIFNCIYFFGNHLSLDITDLFLYHISGLFSMVIFMRLAKQWPIFIKEVTKIENHLQEIRTSKDTDKYCNIMTSIIIAVTFAKYLYWALYKLNIDTQCNTTNEDLIKQYFMAIAPYYFQFQPYSHIAGVVLQISGLLVEFLRSIRDVLILNFSIYLISHFQDLNKIINNHQDGTNNLSWGDLRVHYSRVKEIAEKINATISFLVLQAFLSFVFKSCMKLASTFQTTTLKLCDKDVSDMIRQSPLYLSYNLCTFCYHFMRFIMTSLITANVNVVAKEPLLALDSIHSSDYNVEVQRFRSMIMHSQVAISGMLFSVTRPMIIQIFGSIITYVAVLVQYG